MIASKKETLNIMKENNLIAKKGYGQNFLINSDIVDKIIDSCNIDENTLVIEIGPGLGALTEKLVKVSKKVIAIEIDKRMVEMLHKNVNSNNLEIINEDFLKTNVNKIIDDNSSFNKVIIVSNLPYYITSDIIEKIILLRNDKIKQMIVMMQKEVGKKLLKKEDKIESFLKVLIDNYCHTEVATYVGKNDFEPRPNVDSIVLKISLNMDKYELNYYLLKIIKSCIAGKRKTLINSLPCEKSKSIEILKKLEIKENVRVEELFIEDLLKIALEVQNNEN